MIAKKLILLFALFAAAGRPGPAPRLDSWRVLGPGGGGTMIGPTISPHDPNFVVEHCDMTGAYITTDGARSWRIFNLRSVVSTFAFDPRDPAVIYAGNAALWRSDDRGKSWQMIFPDPAKNTVEHMRGDHADYGLTSDDPSYPTGAQIEAIAVDPSDSRQIYLGISSGLEAASPRSALLHLSRNRGTTWEQLAGFPGERILAVHLARNGASAQTEIYVIGRSGIHVSAGAGWEHRAGPFGGPIQQTSVGRGEGVATPRIYAIVESKWKPPGEPQVISGGIQVSDDGGRTWRASLSGLQEKIFRPGADRPPRFSAISCAAGNSLAAYVGFEGLRMGEGSDKLFNGIARTSDGGRHWIIVHQESNRPSANLEASWIEARAPEGGSIWFDTPYSLGVAPGNADICYATDLFRTYLTADGGKTWKQVNSVRMGPDRWTTRGLDVTTCYGVHFDPFDTKHIFITYTDIGMFQSEDGGISWTGSTEGIPREWRNTTYWIELDPKVKGLVWGAFSGTHDLPRPKMWRNRNPERFRGGVAFSTDGGRDWTLSNSGMPETAVTHILMDPQSPAGSRTLYATGFGRGVFKSADNGKSWVLKNAGIEGKQPFAWRLTRAADSTLYLVVARRSERGRIGNEDDGALYRSSDGAEHWVRMPLPAGTNGPNALTLDPSNDKRMYLSAWGVMTPGGDTGGGVFLSEDSGKTWRSIFTEGQHVYDLTVDPANPKILYLCGFNAGVWRSIDAGAAWSRIRGYNFKWGHRVIPDPVRRDRIYVTTYGGSVWHGPAAGDSKAPEDISKGVQYRK